MMEQLDTPERLCPPLAPRLAGQLTAWWDAVFQTSFDWLAGPLAGTEDRHTKSALYLFKRAGRIAATCRLAHSLDEPGLGCLGEVATDPPFRGQGLARALCRAAAGEFESGPGWALFLASGNPSARQLYAALGWKPVAGSNAMLRLSGPEAGRAVDRFLDDYFHGRPDVPVTVSRGGPSCRIPMIPLILTPHRWFVLDYNAGIFSTRRVRQPSCEGLYDRYACLDLPGEAAWFAALRADGAVVGLASARRLEDRHFRVDGFAHARYEDRCLEALYRRALCWARRHGGARIQVPCAQHDRLKASMLRKVLQKERYAIKPVPLQPNRQGKENE